MYGEPATVVVDAVLELRLPRQQTFNHMGVALENKRMDKACYKAFTDGQVDKVEVKIQTRYKYYNRLIKKK